MSNKKGFTYIELLVALAVMAILIVPVMQLFSYTMNAVSSSQGLIVATNLAKWQMERVRNLNFTTKKFQELGTVIYPPLDEDPWEMNGVEWRIKTEYIGSSPLEVRVHVCYAMDMDKPIVTLVTLIEDMSWEQIVPNQ